MGATPFSLASGARSERQRAKATGIEAEIPGSASERELQRIARPEGVAQLFLQRTPHSSDRGSNSHPAWSRPQRMCVHQALRFGANAVALVHLDGAAMVL